jgi:hypothetical protein
MAVSKILGVNNNDIRLGVLVDKVLRDGILLIFIKGGFVLR